MSAAPHTVDRFGWPTGEWDDEPDYLSWTDANTGLPCLIVRNQSGALCGYVAVEEGHPAYGKEYENVDADVHGGLTYSDRCQGAVCHVPAPGKPDNVWWLGFDCIHSGDLAPGMGRYSDVCGGYDRYRNVAYVQRECGSLAMQLAAMTTTGAAS